MHNAHRRLRELIKLVLVETPSTGTKNLKKWSQGDEWGTFETALAAKGAYPIPQEGVESLIGSGASNKAFEVLWKGRRAIARVPIADGKDENGPGDEEYESFMRFIAAKSKLPKKYAKHFPAVYATFDIEHDFEDYYGKKHHQVRKVIIVEFLQPLPPGLLASMSRTSRQDVPAKDKLAVKLSPGQVKAIVDAVSSDPKIREKLMTFYHEKIVPLLRHKLPFGEFKDELDVIVDKTPGRDDRDELYEFVVDIGRAIGDPLIPPDEINAKPRDADLVAAHPAAVVREFWEFLQALKSVGVNWGDLHSGNYMQRLDGTLVVVDPGYF